ncbi:YtxH domain-containing protein [Bacillus canaveralius]|uniref:YtxH domain-containing protein n=1 Tax=Bacillus canaveralius TaxID=1403243 RepID=A0A2N5GH78_9BACI|nr:MULTISPECIES: YtxH domain-containing protein [Bacillus]PLR80147.1 YtxH domain-containing protein [Bacillus canaveralius]PLR83815.1 YtxH domain-containing protein [Bacillus sp. V33-4]PLR98711.1 YtxH domain-containing protein [Bacillus canaveralius]RSK48212.1 YtxH domain-containing protein [Bacillus canaveralius]
MVKERSQFEGFNENNSGTSRDFVLGAIIGGVVGAATALLLAPNSGRELRSDLKEQAGMLKEKTNEYREAAMTKGSDLAAQAKEKTGQLRETAMTKGGEVVSIAKQKTSSVAQQSTDLLNKVRSSKNSSESGSQVGDGTGVNTPDEYISSESAIDVLSETENKGSIQTGNPEAKLEETKKAFDETEKKLNQKH